MRLPQPVARIPALAALLTLPVAALAPGPLAAQQDSAQVTRAARAAGAADTLAADTLAQDSTLTPTERALQRLRALPRTPVQPGPATLDSLRADSVARGLLPTDSLPSGYAVDSTGTVVDSGGVAVRPMDSAADSTGAAGPGREAADSAAAVPPDSVAGAAADTSRLRPEPPDTVRRFLGPDPIVIREGAIRSGGAGRAADEPPRTEADVRAELEALGGYVTTEYRGDRATFWAGTSQLEIGGDSRISREGSTLETDSLLVYDGQQGVVCGYGEPVLTGDADPVTSDKVCFDIDRDVGMAQGARTRFTQGATWYVRGADNQVYILAGRENETIYGRRAEFTSCDLDHPHYTFEARSLKMVANEMMVARDVTLQFEDVPVFWLPWMVQSMKRGRRSGILMPQFGVNDIVRNSTGYNRHLSNVGFYWAINDYVSASSTFEWFSDNWTAVQGGLSYYWRRQFLQGSLNARHFWRQQLGAPASREFTLRTNNSWRPDERTTLQLNANYASSSQFVRDNSFDPRELNQSIRSSASANRQFDWGSMSLGADRQQQLSTGQVDWTLPSLNLSLSPLTVLSTDDGFDITWNGSGSATRRTKDVLEDSLPNVRDSEDIETRLNHRISAGRLSLSQNLNYSEQTLGAKPALDTIGPDTVAVPEQTGEELTWSTSLSYQQNLWTGTSLSPSLSVNGRQVRDEATRQALEALGRGTGEFVAAPLRISSGASLTTALYGFWPGVGRYSRIRHKIAPSLRWSYSPKPAVSAVQDSVFGVRNLREQNRLTLTFSQTFEAKVEEDDEEAADTVALGQPGEPQRLPQAEKITLLALSTGTPFVYDFVAAREDGRGFLTDEISNSIRSDLLDGLQLSVSHDLFDEGETPEDGGVAPRTFAPFLTRLSASFSIDNTFWLFRLLGLSAGEAGSEVDREQEEADAADDTRLGPQGPGAEGAERSPGGVGSIVPADDRAGRRGGGPGVGRWRAALRYSLHRRRLEPGAVDTGNELLRAEISFDPTENWSVRWSTGYSLSDSEFQDHYLTLSRDLHRWTANFDFIRAQNGNFAMQFRVQLRDNPDLKLDYDQRNRNAGRAVAPAAAPEG